MIHPDTRLRTLVELLHSFLQKSLRLLHFPALDHCPIRLLQFPAAPIQYTASSFGSSFASSAGRLFLAAFFRAA